MVRLRVLDLLKEQGKTKYSIYKQLGMSYLNFNKMVNNETKSIRYEIIEALCLMLNCVPNDLFEFDFELPAKATSKNKPKNLRSKKTGKI